MAERGGEPDGSLRFVTRIIEYGGRSSLSASYE